MAKKDINFTVNQLIIDSSTFGIQDFTEIVNDDLETIDVNNKEEKTKEIIAIKKVNKNCIDERFVSIYFLQGSKYPYSDTVIDAELTEIPNPRDVNKIELNEQFFALVDVQSQRIYVSNQNKKFIVRLWLEKKTDKEVVIKPLFEEEEFINKLKTIDALSVSVVPDLFNEVEDTTLSKSLVADIYGYGAKKARVTFEYEHSHVTDTIKSKLNTILHTKNDFETISIIGRDEEGLENILNIQEIMSKLPIEIQTEGEPKLLDQDAVFNALIERIK